jgi:competence protein ComGC
MSRKLQSFTISELLIVLIITSIVVGMAFSVLELTRKEIDKINQNKKFETEINQVELKLSIDMNSFAESKILDKNILFKNEVDSVQYEILEDKLILKEDTLLSNVIDIKCFFKGHKVEKGDFDACKFIVEMKKDIYATIFVYKINDATTDLN